MLIPGAPKKCDPNLIEDAIKAVKKYSNGTGIFYKLADCKSISEGIHINLVLHNCTNDAKDTKDCDALVHYNATSDTMFLHEFNFIPHTNAPKNDPKIKETKPISTGVIIGIVIAILVVIIIITIIVI